MAVKLIPTYLLIGGGSLNGPNLSVGIDNIHHPTPEFEELSGSIPGLPPHSLASNEMKQFAAGTATSGTATSITLTAAFGLVYPGMVVHVVAGTGAGQSRVVTSVTGGTFDTINWTGGAVGPGVGNMSPVPDATSVFVVVNKTGWGQAVNAWTSALNRPDLWRSQPCGADGKPPPDITFVPWWDSNISVGGVTGAWVVYHHLNSALNTGFAVQGGLLGTATTPVAGTFGSNHYSPVEGGFGADISLMQALRIRHPGSDGWKVFKYAAGFTSIKEYALNSGGEWTAMENEWTDARRLYTRHGAQSTGAGTTLTLVRANVSGTATGGGPLTLVTAGGLAGGQLATMEIEITGGTGAGQVRIVKGNDATTITVTTAWTTNPASGSTFTCRYVVNEYQGCDLFFVSGTGAGQEARIASNTSTTFTFEAPVVTAPDATTVFRVNDRPDFKGCFVDSIIQDILDVDLLNPFAYGSLSAYAAQLTDKLRDQARPSGFKLPAECPIVWHQPHPSIAAPTRAAITASARSYMQVLTGGGGADARPNCILMDCSDLTIGGTGSTHPPVDGTQYDAISYIRQGYKLDEIFAGWWAQTPSTVSDPTWPSRPVPVYIFLGDSTAVGMVDPAVAGYTNQESILGPFTDPYGAGTGNIYRVRQWVWNGQNNTLERFSPALNANRLGTIDTHFGPETWATKKLAEEHPEGIVFIKMAVNSATLTQQGAIALGSPNNTFDPTVVTGNFPKLVSEFHLMMAALVNQGVPYGVGTYQVRFPDVRDCFVQLGDNDCVSTAAAEEFALDAPLFVDEIRRAFSSRTKSELGVVWVRIKKPNTPTSQGGDPIGGSNHGLASARLSIRQTITNLAAVRSSVAVVDLDDNDKFELERQTSVSRVHWGLEMTINGGYAMADAGLALELSSGTGAGAGGGAGDSAGTSGDDIIDASEVSTDDPDPTAPFVVEDGTGKTDANAFCTVQFVRDYWRTRGNPTTVFGATDAAVQDGIRQATDFLHTGQLWLGSRVKQEQALAWPRYNTYDRDDYLIPSNVVWINVQQATAYLARKVIEGVDLLGLSKEDAEQAVDSESVKVGPIDISVDYAGAQEASPLRFKVVDDLLASVVADSGGALEQVPITR